MPARTRSRVNIQMTGKAGFNWQGPYDPSMGQLSNGFAVVDDIINVDMDCQPFTVSSLTTEGGHINRDYGGDDNSYWFHQYVCLYFRSDVQGSHAAVSGLPSESQRCTNAAARTNPSRPYVDVPVNILDIRTKFRQIKEDLDDLLRRMPRRYRRAHPFSHRRNVREFGNAWLQWKFLIEPIVGDIVKAANAADQINRRIRDINRLYSGRGLRRTVSHGDNSKVLFDTSQTVQSLYTTLSVPENRITTVAHRTHIRWAPENKCALRPPPEVIRAWATRAVFGGTVDLSTLWNITPWTWLADWFTNVGEYLVANRNIIPGRVTGVYPMTHTKTETSFQGTIKFPTSTRPVVLSSAKRIRERKERRIGTVSMIAHFPFLNGSQMGILAALAASRTRSHAF